MDVGIAGGLARMHFPDWVGRWDTVLATAIVFAQRTGRKLSVEDVFIFSRKTPMTAWPRLLAPEGSGQAALGSHKGGAARWIWAWRSPDWRRRPVAGCQEQAGAR